MGMEYPAQRRLRTGNHLYQVKQFCRTIIRLKPVDNSSYKCININKGRFLVKVDTTIALFRVQEAYVAYLVQCWKLVQKFNYWGLGGKSNSYVLNSAFSLRAFTEVPTFLAALIKVESTAAASNVHLSHTIPTSLTGATVTGHTSNAEGRFSWMACGY